MSRSKNNSKNTGRNAVRPYTVMCTDMYLLWILIVFPLYYADGYFHLPEKKAMFWTVSTLVYVIVCMFGAVITAFSMRENWSMENLKKNITMTDVFMFGFLVSNLIALAISDDPMGSWVGANARYYGARVLVLVCVAYFLVSRYAWINQVFIWAFLIGGNGVCLLATFDYFGMDVLGINKQMQPSDWLVFISTMGNANTCASYVTMAVAGAICYFCVAKGMKAKVFAGISIVNCSMALITARSDSAFVGVAVVIAFLSVLKLVRTDEVRDYFCMLLLVDAGMLLLLGLRKLFVRKLLDAQYDSGVSEMLIEHPIFLIAVFVMLMLIWGMSHYIRKKKIQIDKRKKAVLVVLTIVVSLVIIIVVLCKFEMIKIIEVAMGYSHDIYSRKYCYEMTINSYLKLPIKNKVLGCGQASFATVVNRYYGQQLAQHGISYNSAHNNILDCLIAGGILGVSCYAGILINVIKHGTKVFGKNKFEIIFVGCIVAYFSQALFNIDQTNTTTIYWLMIACCEAVYRKSVMKKEDY